MARFLPWLQSGFNGVAHRILAVGLLLVATSHTTAEASVCGTVADDFIAAEVGLVREWIVQVPFDSAAWRLEHVAVGKDLVVAQSRDGGVAAIQAAPVEGAPRPGRVLWSNRIGAPGGFSLPAGIGPELVTIARDLDVYALDRTTGHVNWREQIGSTADGPATTVGSWVYAPVGGQLLRLPVNPLRAPTARRSAAPSDEAGSAGRRPAERSTAGPREEPVASTSINGGGRVAFPVRGDEDAVFWSTTNGRLVALEQIDGRWNRAEFQLDGPPVSTPPVRGRSMFVAVGADGSAAPTLARIDLLTTGVERLRWGWWYPLPDRPDQGPFLAGDSNTLIVSLGPSGLAAYSTETGEVVWRSCVVGTIVAVSAERAWVIDELGRLSGIEVATGVAREWLSLGCLTVPVINTVSDRLVLASPTGLVVSLAPRNRLPAPAAAPPAGDAPAAAPADMPAGETTDPLDPDAAPAPEDPDATPL